MAILNYTTKVGVPATTAEIQRILAKYGARAIMTDYDSAGEMCAISFMVMQKEEPLYFKLPVDVEGVSRSLKRDKHYRDEAHSRRVAWRILKDWIEAQMAIIDAQMAELPQVFLPYAKTATGETVYERMKGTEFKLLGGPNG